MKKSKKKTPNFQELKAIGLLLALAENVVSGSKWADRKLANEIERIDLDKVTHDVCRRFELEHAESSVPSAVTLFSRGDHAEILLDGSTGQYFQLDNTEKKTAVQLFCTYESETVKSSLLNGIFKQEHVLYSFPCEDYSKNKKTLAKHNGFKKIVQRNYIERVNVARKMIEKPSIGVVIDYSIEQSASVTNREYCENVIGRAIDRFNNLAKAEYEINPGKFENLEAMLIKAYQTFDYTLPNIFTKKYLVPAFNLFEMVFTKYVVFRKYPDLLSNFNRNAFSKIGILLEGESFYEEGNGKKGFVGLHFDQIRKELDI